MGLLSSGITLILFEQVSLHLAELVEMHQLVFQNACKKTVVTKITHPCTVGSSFLVQPNRLDFQYAIDGDHFVQVAAKPYRRKLGGVGREPEPEQGVHQTLHVAEFFGDVQVKMRTVVCQVPQVAEPGLGHVILYCGHLMGQCSVQIPEKPKNESQTDPIAKLRYRSRRRRVPPLLRWAALA